MVEYGRLMDLLDGSVFQYGLLGSMMIDCVLGIVLFLEFPCILSLIVE